MIPAYFSPNDDTLKTFTPEMLRDKFLVWEDPAPVKKTELQKLKKLGISVNEQDEFRVAHYKSKKGHVQIKESLLPRFFQDFNQSEMLLKVKKTGLTNEWIEKTGCCYRWLICKFQDQKVPTKPPPKGKVFAIKPKYLALKSITDDNYNVYSDLTSWEGDFPMFAIDDDVPEESPVIEEKKKKRTKVVANGKASRPKLPSPPNEKLEAIKIEKEKRDRIRERESDFNLSFSERKRKVPIRFAKSDPNCIIPNLGTYGSAGFDVFSVENSIIKKNENKAINTGLIMEIPDNFFIRIHSRSGLALKEKITVEGGVIDSDYRGTVYVLLRNNSSEKDFHIKKGDKIAQMILEKRYIPDFIQIVENELTKTERKGGFGSTG